MALNCIAAPGSGNEAFELGGFASRRAGALREHRTWITLTICFLVVIGSDFGYGQEKEFFPEPPSDRSVIYMADSKNAIYAIPFEKASTPLKPGGVARSDKVSYIELKGPQASAFAPNDTPRFYLFVSDKPGVHPPFLVRFAARSSSRRVTAAEQRGERGFAISSEEIIKPLYRVLSQSDGFLFMEFRSRVPLAPGEYGFIGTDLGRVATFRVG